MDSANTAALIGAAGAILGAAVTAFAPDIKVLLSGKARSNSDLIGEWRCRWFVEQESGEEINDIVKISRVWGEKLYARGINTQYGDYEITGRMSRSYLVTLHYEGIKERQPLGGVVIMKLNATRTEMNGFWYEYGREERMVGGPTEWKKTT